MSENKNVFKKHEKDYSKLLVDRYVEKWLGNVKSKRARLSSLNRFLNFVEKNPSEIILEHHEDTLRFPIEQTNIAKNQLKAFYNYLIGEKNSLNDKIIQTPISINSARQYVYSKLASFFKRNGVPLIFEKGEIPNEDQNGTQEIGIWKNGTKRLGRDEKKDCLKQIRDTFKNVRNKAILLCKISSGLDDVDLFKLTIKDFNNGYYSDLNVAYITGNRQKRLDCFYQTFFNSEACDMIHIYFKEREKKGEKLSEESDLFVSEKSGIRCKKCKKDKSKCGCKKFQEEIYYKKIKRSAFSENLKTICETLNLHNITPKSFRRWFSTELSRNGIEFEIRERLMGHKVSMSQRYDQLLKDQEAFVEFYVSNIESITLLGNSGNKKLTEMDKKVERLETQLKDLLEEKQELKIQLKNTDVKIDTLIGIVKGYSEETELLDSLISKKKEVKKDGN